jgi:hypothetical protein
MVDILTLKVRSDAVAAIEVHTALIRGVNSLELQVGGACGQSLLSSVAKAN